MRKLTPDVIHSLPPGGVFVFGANSKGIHGSGAALFAKKYFGAIQGQSRGLQGRSYAVITKSDWRKIKSSSLSEILLELIDLCMFALAHPQRDFYVTLIGTKLAGYTEEEIKGLWVSLGDGVPDNIILPKQFEYRE